MASLSFIIGIIGNIISILVFASPIKTFWHVVKKKSTENYKGTPYITTLLSTSLWTFYGLLNPDGLLVTTVNGAGIVFQFIYVTLFLIYAPKDKKIKTAKLVALVNVGFLGLVIAVTLLAIHGRIRLTFVGILCAVLTIGMYASPLSAMRIVIKTKSVEYMPFFLSFFLFLNAGTKCYWLCVGVSPIDHLRNLQEEVNFSKISGEDERKGSAHFVKVGIEMGALEGDEEANLNDRSLHKGRSLPKPSVI
ncbi:SWEET sugar transporter [Fagus crenata]